MRNEKTDGPGLPWRPFDQSVRFQRQDHLVNRRRRDSEVLLHFGFGRRAPVDFTVVVNERQILPLLGSVGFVHRLADDCRPTLAEQRTTGVTPEQDNWTPKDHTSERL
jgi:hypothetical protein